MGSQEKIASEDEDDGVEVCWRRSPSWDDEEKQARAHQWDWTANTWSDWTRPDRWRSEPRQKRHGWSWENQWNGDPDWSARRWGPASQSWSSSTPQRSGRCWGPSGVKSYHAFGMYPTEGLWHVYCDMDGVLSDFERGVSELLGSPPDEFRDSDAVAEMWGKLAAE